MPSSTSAPPLAKPLSVAVERAAGPGARSGLLRGASQVMLSQALLAAVGLGTLPVLGRQLGPADYGGFSLFVTLIGVVTYQDVARQLLIHEQARGAARPAELDALTRLSTALIVGLALAIAPLVLSPLAAAALVAVTLLHGLASRDYAQLAVEGQVGAATAVRNFAWAAAFAGVAALSFVAEGTLVYAAPFVVANALTWAVYRTLARRAGPRASARIMGGPWWARASGWATLRSSPDLPRYRRAALDLLGFTLASSAIVSLDRLLLQSTAGADELGLYCGAADVATRVHVVSSALSATLYPMFATLLHERGRPEAARHFVRIATWVVSAYFVALLAMLLLDRELLGLLLGPAFAASRPLFALMLVGVFVHCFGFLLTPWQRAQGDFATQRGAYVRAALLMGAVGALTVPLYGALGALTAYLCSRVAELQLVLHELRRLPRELRVGRRLIVAAAMLAVLASIGAWRFLEAP